MVKNTAKGRNERSFNQKAPDEKCGACLFSLVDAAMYGLEPSFSDFELCKPALMKTYPGRCREFTPSELELVGLPADHEKFRKLLPILEEEYMRKAKQPVFHLYYFSPNLLNTNVLVGKSTPCSEAVQSLIEPN